MMNGWDSGWWVVMPLLWVGLIILIVWAVAQLFPGRGDRSVEREEQPGEILDRRLARGEIDSDTYDALRAKLGGGTPGAVGR